MPNNEIQDRLQELRDVWQYDEGILDRIDGDLRTIRRYVAVRQAHEELAQVPKDEYDPIPAFDRRLKAHGRPKPGDSRRRRPQRDLRDLRHRANSASVPGGADPYGLAHRTRVASFAFQL